MTARGPVAVLCARRFGIHCECALVSETIRDAIKEWP